MDPSAEEDDDLEHVVLVLVLVLVLVTVLVVGNVRSCLCVSWET